MRAVVQRVSQAGVEVEGESISNINQGLLVLLGIEEADNEEDITWLCAKIVRLRIFDDEEGIMNRSVLDVGGEILIVSQFTLHASTKKGNRPSYIRAAKPDRANLLYEMAVNNLSQELGKRVATGKFQAMMKVNLVNDGPVTIIIDTKNKE